MTIEQYADRYGETYSPEVILAARFLERLGLVFCHTFGYNNAVDIADDVMSWLGEDGSAEFLWVRYGINLPVSLSRCTILR